MNDATRYRFLRDGYAHHTTMGWYINSPYIGPVGARSFNEAVDAAISVYNTHYPALKYLDEDDECKERSMTSPAPATTPTRSGGSPPTELPSSEIEESC